MRSFLAIGLLLLSTGTAQAAWHKASSAHFVVYADDSEKDIRRFSEQLERYHSAMEALTGAGRIADPPSPSNRVTVYVVDSSRDVRKLYGEGSKYVGGFYMPRAGGSFAIVPRVDAARGEAGYSMVVLLHEYAHHYMTSVSSFPEPRWLVEGAAEFFSQARFEKDETVWLGRFAEMRLGELFYARDVRVEELLDPATYENKSRQSYDAFYGKSWLLYHYLMFDEGRTGQMVDYVGRLMRGTNAREAALAAFGDFAELDKELDRYLDRVLSRGRIVAFKLPPSMVRTGPITVTALSEGEAAMMPVRIRSRRGVNEEQAAEVVVEARTIAARYPDDPAVLSALAEAEFDAGNEDRAIAAADAALARDPAQVNAYVQKGYALFELAKDAKDPKAAYQAARAPFIALNRIENDHPLPLVYYYRSYVDQGDAPTELARNGLERALELAPFDTGLRMNVAQMQISTGEREKARRTLEPLAYSPHGGGIADAARAMLERLGGGPGAAAGAGARAAPAGRSADAGD